MFPVTTTGRGRIQTSMMRSTCNSTRGSPSAAWAVMPNRKEERAADRRGSQCALTAEAANAKAGTSFGVQLSRSPHGRIDRSVGMLGRPVERVQLEGHVTDIGDVVVKRW